jgi:YidC/Oxa1 family membrane protein insertase
VRVVTDVLDIIIDTKGGNIVQTNLLDYPQELGSENTIRLQNSSNSGFYAVQSGLLAKAGAPNHYAQFDAQQKEYVLADGQDSITVPLSWEENGIQVTKLYSFKRGDYLIDQTFQVKNNTQQEWAGNQYRQIQRSEVDDSTPFIYTYTGGVYYNEEDKYEKVEYGDMEDENLNKSFDKGWTAMIQHYFMTALVPSATETNKYYSKVVESEYGKRYVMGLTSTKKKVAPAETAEFKTEIYIGPKILDRLEVIAPGLELAVDFGMLTIISKPMYIALNWIHSVVGNWGWAIVLLTIGLKMLFFPLANASYKSMAKMKKVMPEVQKLKEKYGDDKQRIAKEQMAIFQKNKVNPAAGCFPMLIQMPVFMGLYWALLESVELRQAPFILWINDLSIADPYFILPVIMGASMFLQQKLNPPPADPMQAKMMQMMPIMFSVFFFFLPVGLVLYSVTNNTLSIIQQYVITKRIENE